jgi:hypothetical protein
MQQDAKTSIQYFVGHRLTPENIDDLRGVIADVLGSLGYEPFYADKALEGQSLLAKICQRIFLTSFSVFDLSSANPNLYLEMGIALGLNRPIIAIARNGTTLPPVLQGHNVVMYTDYADLEAKLLKLCTEGFPPTTPTLPDHCHFCGRVCGSMATMPDENSYLVLDNYKLLWRDLMRLIGPYLAQRQLHPVYLTEQSFGPLLCDMRRKVLSSQFVICHLGKANESSFLALGMAIGGEVPWLLLSKKHHDPVPSNLQGFDRIEYTSLADFEEQLTDTLNGFLEMVMPTPGRGNGATAPIQSRPFWTQFRDWLDSIPHASHAPKATQGRIRVIRYEGQRCSSKYIIPPEGLLFGRSSECDVVLQEQYVSLRHFRVLRTRSRKSFIEDLGSRNGTLLNGTRLSPGVRAMLSFGDRIKLPGARTWFAVWDDRPLPEPPSSQAHFSTGVLPPVVTIEIPDVPPPTHLRNLDLSLILTALHPSGLQRITFEVQAYYPMGRILSELVDSIGLPHKSYRFKVANRFIDDEETPLSVGLKEGDSIIIVSEEAHTGG